MEQISGKVLIFSDQHFGLKGNSETKLKIAIEVFKAVIAYVKKNDIKYVISAGDIFHQRTAIDVNVMNAAYRCIAALAKHCKIYLIAGNHDCYFKTTTDVNSINMFRDIENVQLVNEVTQICINKKNALLVPWLGDVSQQQKEFYNLMIGHFEISSKYLIRSYIEEHSNTTTIECNKDVLDDEMLKTKNCKSNQSSSDLVGDFVEIVKRNGIIFAGHIHTRKEFIAKGRKFIFIGSPYQQNLGEKDCTCGFYILNEDCSYEFHEIASIPKHVEIRMSDVVKDLDSFDFSFVKGNILHKIYDIEVDPVLDSKISQKIQDFKPFEELLPDYEVKIDSAKSDEMINESVELLKKSKLEYISNYIQNIDQKVLDESKLDRKILFETLERYYNDVAQ